MTTPRSNCRKFEVEVDMLMISESSFLWNVDMQECSNNWSYHVRLLLTLNSNPAANYSGGSTSLCSCRSQTPRSEPLLTSKAAYHIC